MALAATLLFFAFFRQGDVLAAFNLAAMTRGNDETPPNFYLAMQDLAKHMLPRCAL